MLFFTDEIGGAWVGFNVYKTESRYSGVLSSLSRERLNQVAVIIRSLKICNAIVLLFAIMFSIGIFCIDEAARPTFYDIGLILFGALSLGSFLGLYLLPAILLLPNREKFYAKRIFCIREVSLNSQAALLLSAICLQLVGLVRHFVDDYHTSFLPDFFAAALCIFCIFRCAYVIRISK